MWSFFKQFQKFCLSSSRVQLIYALVSMVMIFLEPTARQGICTRWAGYTGISRPAFEKEPWLKIRENYTFFEHNISVFWRIMQRIVWNSLKDFGFTLSLWWRSGVRVRRQCCQLSESGHLRSPWFLMLNWTDQILVWNEAANVLLCSLDLVKLSDFGWACPVRHTQHMPPSIAGNSRYPPEPQNRWFLIEANSLSLPFVGRISKLFATPSAAIRQNQWNSMKYIFLCALNHSLQ